MKIRIRLIPAAIILMILLSDPLRAEDGVEEDNNQDRGAWKERIFFGGGIDFSISSSHTAFSLSPLVGYKITDRVWSGITLRYAYFNWRERTNMPAFTTSLYGGSVFTRYFIGSGFFAMGEIELLNYGFYNRTTEETERVWMEGLLAGGGYQQRIGDRSRIEILLLYNFTEHERYPYTNPVVRVGVVF